MTGGGDDFSELQDLLELLCEGRAEAAQFARIQQLAQSSQAAMKFYVDYLDQHARLMWRFRRFAAESFVDAAPCGTNSPDATPLCGAQGGPILEPASENALDQSSHLGSAPPFDSPARPGGSWALGFVSDCFQQFVGAVGGYVVLLVFVAVTSCITAMLLLGHKSNSQQAAGLDHLEHSNDRLAQSGPQLRDSPAIDPSANTVIARITDSHSARWRTKAGLTEQPPVLAVGSRLDLNAGLVEMTFDNGALVLLEGPAQLVLDSPMRATLLLGQLTANIPPPAIGFTIETPMVNVVDLGTEFGVRVSQKGMTDVAVFSGKVVAHPRQVGAVAAPAIPVVADEVRRFWSGSIVDEEPLAAPNFTLAIPRPLPVTNASFESPELDSWMNRSITGWTVVSKPAWQGRLNGGVQLAHPDRLQLPSPPSGRQWGFIETRKAPQGGVYHTSIYQAVGKLVPKSIYRLKMTIGYEGYTTHGIAGRYPFSWDGQDTFEIGLWSGRDKHGEPTQPLKVVRDPVPNLPPGGTQTAMLTFQSPAEMPVDGGELFIRMSLSASDWCRILFDDVQLEAMPVGNSWATKAGDPISSAGGSK